MTHDYRRHGTTTLFAALDTATSKVLNHCFAHHPNREFLAFLKMIDGQVARHLDIHLVLDNYATQKHSAIAEWLGQAPPEVLAPALHRQQLVVAQPRRAVVKGADKKLRRSTSPASTTTSTPSTNGPITGTRIPGRIWHASAEEIIAKVRRGRAALSTVTKSATDH